MAGLSVDMILFPLDTIKTRLQSVGGFYMGGGFSGIYRGIGPQFIGSVPQAALFFCTYEFFKAQVHPLVSSQYHPFVHMGGAAVAEVISCLIRVPVEVVKQRRQTGCHSRSSMKIAIDAYRQEGVFKGLYRGFGSTIAREIPFSFIQFPLWEYLKVVYLRNVKKQKELHSYEVALCGSIAGGTAAALTTPLDVVKTRIMLADRKHVTNLKTSAMFLTVYNENGLRGLFAGFVPRVMWITLGGCIFFGVYDFSSRSCTNILETNLL